MILTAVRALLVEDHTRLARFMRKALEEAGLDVDVAQTAHSALARALTEPYDLLVLDLTLPDGEGLDILRHVRESGATTPVLVVSARDTVDERVTGLDAGADDYLVKPFSVQELVARARALLRRPARFRPIAIGNLQIDPVQHATVVKDRTLALTPKEQTVLEVLARHVDHTVPRTALIEGVWGFQFDGLDNALEAHISALRRALRLAGATAEIVTVRRVGYRLAVVGAA